MTLASPTPPRAAVLLTLASSICAAATSLTTLFWAGAFPSPVGEIGFNGALAEARGWSLVTAAVTLPLLALALAAARKGSHSGYLAWLGVLAYLIYTYLELAVSPPFTALYLPYIVAFACAIPALVIGVSVFDARALAGALGNDFPRRSIASFAFVTGALLSLAWLKPIVAQTLAATFEWPTGLAAIGHVVHALDLGLQVPLGIATGVLLLRRKPGGVVLSGILLTNSICMGLALTAMVVSSALAAGRNPIEAAPFALLPAVAATLAVRFVHAIELAGGSARTPHFSAPAPSRDSLLR
jgi:hypothetical protein